MNAKPYRKPRTGTDLDFSGINDLDMTALDFTQGRMPAIIDEANDDALASISFAVADIELLIAA